MHAKCMAVKTITIDLEAYDTLKRHKREGQSFSQVIKQHFGGRKTAGALLAAAREIHLEEKTLDVVDDLIERRREDPAQPARL